METMLKTGAAAHKLGVTPKTLQRWDRCGTFSPLARSPTGLRLYSESQILERIGCGLAKHHIASSLTAEYRALRKRLTCVTSAGSWKSFAQSVVWRMLNLWMNSVVDSIQAPRLA